jgi:hypothetical protein
MRGSENENCNAVVFITSTRSQGAGIFIAVLPQAHS